MRKTTLTTLLLLSALAAAPASANWFARPEVGLNLNVGSAPNPTPADLRALYGPTRYGFYRVSVDVLSDMEGKAVYGENGEHLGFISNVDLSSRLVQLQLSTGRAVALDAGMFVNHSDHVTAPTLSMTEANALA